MLILLSFVLPLFLGALLGFGGGIFSIGGGLIVPSILVTFFRQSQAMAQGCQGRP